MDVFDPQKRSEIMSRVRGKDTKPELRVRSHLHGTGLRYVKHDQRLPGKPDLSFPSRRLALFVHGCFWHGHEGCKKATIPATRPEFWRAKIKNNKARDERVKLDLAMLGWDVRIVWQCSINPQYLTDLAADIAAMPRARRTITKMR
jgi:DNA mismatch endonuclease, patch repair protein